VEIEHRAPDELSQNEHIPHPGLENLIVSGYALIHDISQTFEKAKAVLQEEIEAAASRISSPILSALRDTLEKEINLIQRHKQFSLFEGDWWLLSSRDWYSIWQTAFDSPLNAQANQLTRKASLDIVERVGEPFIGEKDFLKAELRALALSFNCLLPADPQNMGAVGDAAVLTDQKNMNFSR